MESSMMLMEFSLPHILHLATKLAEPLPPFSGLLSYIWKINSLQLVNLRLTDRVT